MCNYPVDRRHEAQNASRVETGAGAHDFAAKRDRALNHTRAKLDKRCNGLESRLNGLETYNARLVEMINAIRKQNAPHRQAMKAAHAAGLDVGGESAIVKRLQEIEEAHLRPKRPPLREKAGDGAAGGGDEGAADEDADSKWCPILDVMHDTYPDDVVLWRGAERIAREVLDNPLAHDRRTTGRWLIQVIRGSRAAAARHLSPLIPDLRRATR